MVHCLKAVRKTDGRLCDYYLSWQDFKAKSELDTQAILLSLGKTHPEWFRETHLLSEYIYGELIADFVNGDLGKQWYSLSERQAEILFGSLASGLAKQLSRAIFQVKKLLLETEPGSVRVSINYDHKLMTPIDNSELRSTLTSRKFTGLVNDLVLDHYCGLKTQFSVSSSRAASEEERFTHVSRKTKIYQWLQNHTSPLSSRNDIVVINSYLGRLEEFWLGLTLKQWPLFGENAKSKTAPSPVVLRSCEPDAWESIRLIAKNLASLLIPISLQENLNLTRDGTRRRGFSLRPKVIFTSNSFEDDDEFKLFLVENIDTCSYLVGQHGGRYGVSILNLESVELSTCDLYLSWGWTSKTQAVEPFGVLSRPLRRRLSKPFVSVTLVLDKDLNYYCETDTAETDQHYFERIHGLCKRLNEKSIRTIVRPHPGTSTGVFNWLEDFISKMEFVSLEKPGKSFRRSVNAKSLMVFTYDSTGILEMAAAEIPFFFFAGEGLCHVSENFISNHEVLRRNLMMSADVEESASLLENILKRDSFSLRLDMSIAVLRFAKGIVFRPKKRIKKIRHVLVQAAESRLNK